MKLGTLFISLSLFSTCFAQDSGPIPATPEQMERYVKPLYKLSGSSMAELTYAASELFLKDEIPYKIGITGEGKKGEYDQDPIVTFEGLDCTTFVEASLAAAKTTYHKKEVRRDKKILRRFLKNAKDIKYARKKAIYEERNHFAELDWVLSLQNKGYISDTTLDIFPEASLAYKKISKKEWYKAKTDKDLTIHYKKLTQKEKEKLLHKWQEAGADFEDVRADLYYVPLADLLDKEVQSRFPKILILNMIKGKHSSLEVPVMVSHQGFLVRHDNGELFFRHASTGKKVMEVPFDEYVQTRMKDVTWPTLGFNLQQINEP